MKTIVGATSFSLIALLFAPSAPAQTPPAARSDFKAIASTLNSSAKRTDNVAIFGESIRQQLLSAAAKEAAKGNLASKVNLDFTVRVVTRETRPLPGVPSPSEVNVCWEMCSSIQCYIQCEAPIPKLGR